MRTICVLAIVALATLSACDSKVYDTYHHTPLAGWEKNDTLYYDVPRITRAGIYELTLGVRTNNAFPFMAITLIVDQTILPSRQTVSDTLDCQLVKSGGTYKEGGINYYEYTTHVRTLSLAPQDSLHITVRHDMKRDILPGVSDVGIALSYDSHHPAPVMGR